MDAWAQLVSTTNICCDPVKITKQKFVIGRAHDADLCLAENRLVSGHHCIIEKDSLGNTWLQDISTNGTVLNSTNKISGKRVLLKHGDEIFIVYRNADSDLNVAFLFQDLEELAREELETTDEANGEEADETQPYEETENSLFKPEDEVTEGISTNKRRLGSSADGDYHKEPPAKLVKLSESENREGSFVTGAKVTGKPPQVKEMKLPITSAAATEHNLSNHLIVKGSRQSFQQEQTTSTEKLPEEAVAQVDSEPPLSTDTATSTGVSASSVPEATTSSGVSAPSVPEATTSSGVSASSVPEATTSSGVSAPSVLEATNKTNNVSEQLEEQLTCTICQEILYNSVSLQPCMHTFCAGCYSGWMDRSTDCPTCRQIVTGIKKYHPMKNVIEAYLAACPEKQRPEEDRKRLDAADKITKDDKIENTVARYAAAEAPREIPQENRESDEDGVAGGDSSGDDEDYFPGSGADSDSEDYVSEDSEQLREEELQAAKEDQMAPKCPTRPIDEYYDDEDVSEEEVEDVQYPPPPPPPFAYPYHRPLRTICRQCPGYYGPTSGACSSRAGTPATGPRCKTLPDPPDYTCSENQNHIICLCCFQPMPHRHNEVDHASPEVLPPQQCAICQKAFCHQYWGCFGQCDGCLAKFSDMKFRPDVLNNMILQNTHESRGLRLYLDSKHLTIDDVQRTCVQKLKDGVYTCDDAFLLGADLPICYSCALKNFSQLAFEFRRDIPEAEMPAEFRGRPNCRWGRHCRTQTHNRRHAETYNHICEYM